MSLLVAESESAVVASRPRTVADLLHELGQISAERVRLQPAPGTATEEDLLRTQCCELIDGTLVELAMGFFESRLAVVLAFQFEQYLRSNPIGFTVGADGYTRLEGVGIRFPDVAVRVWERHRQRQVPMVSVTEVLPSLAVEVISPGNTRAEMLRKQQEFLERGTELFWLCDPRKQTVEVTDAHGNTMVLGWDDVLTGEPVLPGFRLKVSDWFARSETAPPPDSQPSQSH